jgi:hypothetical protein
VLALRLRGICWLACFHGPFALIHVIVVSTILTLGAWLCGGYIEDGMRHRLFQWLIILGAGAVGIQWLFWLETCQALIDSHDKYMSTERQAGLGIPVDWYIRGIYVAVRHGCFDRDWIQYPPVTRPTLPVLVLGHMQPEVRGVTYDRVLRFGYSIWLREWELHQLTLLTRGALRLRGEYEGGNDDLPTLLAKHPRMDAPFRAWLAEYPNDDAAFREFVELLANAAAEAQPELEAARATKDARRAVLLEEGRVAALKWIEQMRLDEIKRKEEAMARTNVSRSSSSWVEPPSERYLLRERLTVELNRLRAMALAAHEVGGTEQYAELKERELEIWRLRQELS